MSDFNIQNNQLRSLLDPLESQERVERPLSNKEATDAEGRTFADNLSDSINEVNRLQNEASQMLEKLATGESKDVHGTVIALQKAGTSFKLMMEVRNKLVEAYREVMKSAG